MSFPLISVYCITFNRPKLLARTIACFEAQSWKNKEMIIVCDLGQYEQPQRGAQWEIISFNRKIQSLGEKNNVALSMCRSELIARADDDDTYGVHWLESIVEAFEKNPKAGLLQPRRAIDYVDSEWVQTLTHSPGTDSRKAEFCYHGGYGYRRSWIVNKMRGYAAEYVADDIELDKRRREIGDASIGIDPSRPPYYRYWTRYFKAHPEELNGEPASISVRGGGKDAYFGTPAGPYVGKLPIYSGQPVWEMPVPSKIIPRLW